MPKRIDWQQNNHLTRLEELMKTGMGYARAARTLTSEWGIPVGFNQVKQVCKAHGIASQATRLTEEAAKIKPYTDFWRLEGDWMVCSDLELPFIDPAMIQLLLKQAKQLKVRNLLIAGDIFESDKLSPFDAVVPTHSPSQESAVAYAMMEEILGWFREVRCCCGNHDIRVLKALQGAVEPDDVMAMLASMLGGDKRVHWSLYPVAIIGTPTGDWCVEHPDTARKISLSLATERAGMERMHMITAHEHKTAIGFHPDGQTVVVNIGTMCDPRKLAYAMLKRRAYPKMTQSFAALKDGQVRLFSPHPAWA